MVTTGDWEEIFDCEILSANSECIYIEIEAMRVQGHTPVDWVTGSISVATEGSVLRDIGTLKTSSIGDLHGRGFFLTCNSSVLCNRVYYVGTANQRWPRTCNFPVSRWRLRSLLLVDHKTSQIMTQEMVSIYPTLGFGLWHNPGSLWQTLRGGGDLGDLGERSAHPKPQVLPVDLGFATDQIMATGGGEGWDDMTRAPDKDQGTNSRR
jgi:hypothetical protein